jgi:hypothetical protein
MFFELYNKALINYGIFSGSYYLVLSIAMLAMFLSIFKLIDGGLAKLSESL